MGFLLGIGSSLLGFGKLLFGWILNMITVVFKFALEKPFQFMSIILVLTLLWVGWYCAQTKQELTATQKIVEEKVTFIKGQDKVLKEYVAALKVEKNNHVEDIRRGNNAVASIKKTADAALARAQAAGREVKKDQVKYDQMGIAYGRSNPSTGKPAERIKREEATNDSFINEWKKVSK